MYEEVETVQQLIDALMKVKDKSKPISYRGWGGDIQRSDMEILSVEEFQSVVELV